MAYHWLIKLSDYIASFGSEAIHNCTKFASFIMPKTDTLIYVYTLNSLEFPARVIKIEEKTFEKCRGLEHISFAGLNYNRITFYKLSGLENYTNCFLILSLHEINCFN